MEIKRLEVGYLQANCYILKNNDECIVIDPGDEYEVIKKEITNLKAILVTHNHPDHIGALKQLKEAYKVPVYDYYNLEEGKFNISSFEFNILYTPGHRIDAITFIFEKEKIMFTGDFLFKGTIGRTDLDTGNIGQMRDSIKKIKNYDGYTVYPGHGDKTTIEEEKLYNPFFK